MSAPKAWVDGTPVSVTIDGQGYAKFGSEADPIIAAALAETPPRKATVTIEYDYEKGSAR